MSHHLTYLEAVVTGLIQGVTELFPVSSLGHNVLLPSLIGGSWASALNVSAPDSPYLAFVVGLHVATAIAMIVFFWRDWLRIVRGFVSSLRTRSITTPDERLAWMIILATIPVGIVGAALQKQFTTLFAKPELAAVFLAINGVILLGSERMKRRENAAAAPVPVAADGAQRGPAGRGDGRTGQPPARPGWGDGGAGPGWGDGQGGRTAGGRPAGGPPPEGYSQQPWQQQRQGPDPQYGQDDNWPYGPGRDARHPGGGQQPGSSQYPGNGQNPGSGPEQYGQQPHRGRPAAPGAGDPRYAGQPQYGEPQYGQDQRGARGPQQTADPWGGRDTRGPGGVGGSWDAWGQQRADGHAAGRQPAARRAEVDRAVAADQRLSTMGYLRAVIVGSAQILALFAGISRDGIVTVTGMWRGLSREDAVRFSFLLSAPVILAAGALKAKELTGPMSTGIHGPILVGSLISGVGAYLSLRFLTKYFSEEKSLNPFGIYCLVAGLGSLAYLLLK
jgi:undecaprenyl pyrophosphate phosphatase UppP